MERIDISYDMRTDANGKDPDKYSATLRGYHRMLWSKTLPNGKDLILDDKLQATVDGVHFRFSSDAIVHTYSKWVKYQHIISKVDPLKITDFYNIGCTIGSYIIFPANRVNNRPTINGARGMNRKIGDRFDLTLECIRRKYAGETSPLTNCFADYEEFFSLFVDFNSYVEFFLLQDFVTDGKLNFLHPFDDFNGNTLPKTVEEYLKYREKTIAFAEKRNKRVLDYSLTYLK